MKLFNVAKYFAIFAVAAILFSACTENTTDPTDTDQPKPEAITGLMATTFAKDTISLKFTPSVSESNTLFTDYTLVITPGAYNPLSVPKGTNMVKIGGLQSNTEYTFTIKANYSNDSSSAPVAIKWATAYRFDKNINDDTEVIKVYESASDFGSGLVLYTMQGTTAGSVAKKVANSVDWDLALNTQTTGKIKFGTAKGIGYSYSAGQPGVTEVTDPILADKLNDVYDSQGLDTKNFKEQNVDLSNYTKNIVFYARKVVGGDYYYAKVLVKTGANGFLQGSGNNRYVEVEVSYQATKNLPYAKTSN